MKTHYRAVVIGGGVVGASVLYHLAKFGWTDIALIERAELTAGSTWHAAAGFHALNADPNIAALQNYTIKLYREIEAESGQAIGVVAMGGYNTFCEILSFDKRAVIIPRTQPRMEQYIRAKRAEELGLASMLEDDGQRDWKRMATALRQLPQQALPSDVVVPGLMDGLENLNRLVNHAVERVRKSGRIGERVRAVNNGNGRARLRAGGRAQEPAGPYA
jgi:predicted glycosyltransferase